MCMCSGIRSIVDGGPLKHNNLNYIVMLEANQKIDLKNMICFIIHKYIKTVY